MQSIRKITRAELIIGGLCSVGFTFPVFVFFMLALQFEKKTAWLPQDALAVVSLWSFTVGVTLLMSRYWFGKAANMLFIELRKTFPKVQAAIDHEIRRRMVEFDRLCREQEVVAAECRHTASSNEIHRRLDKLTRALEDAKHSAWDAHGKARAFGFKTRPKVGDYLAETNLTS